MTNGEIIGDFLLSKGMKKKHLADKLGVTPRTLYNLILDKGVRGISSYNINKLNFIFKTENYGKRIK